MKQLTEQVHDFLAARIRVGQRVVDATAGNGFDTEFLARCVGPSGAVLAIDIQAEAIERTRQRIDMHGLTCVEFRQTNHELLKDEVTRRWGADARIHAAIFNLGYLPHGDPEVRTHADSTQTALQDAAELLDSGGVLSVIVYRGHPGGMEEAECVAEFFASLASDDYAVQQVAARTLSHTAPQLFLAQRK